MSRLVLIEFAAVDRFHRGLLFPYIVGFARSSGVEVRWFRFGVRAATQFERDELGVGLEPEELEELLGNVADFDPSHVLFSLEPSGAVLEAVKKNASKAEFALLGDMYAGEKENLFRLPNNAPSWAKWIGFKGALSGQKPFWAETVPDFGYEFGNQAACDMQPLPFLIFGQECTFNKPLKKNPFYEGVDLSDCVRTGGCSFCNRPEVDRLQNEGFNEDLLRSHLEALNKTLPEYNGRVSIRLLGEPAILNIDSILRIVLEIGFPPSDFLLDSRATTLIRKQGQLAEAADSLESSGHKIHLALIGIENFSREELRRMNKGVAPLTNVDAALCLLRLEEQYPTSFGFRDHGGLSLILFTPWTTLDDLALNLSLIQGTSLESVCGKLFTSRLRLEPGLPITALARKDQLIIESYDDDAFDTASKNLYGHEIPWEFADKRVEAPCQILIRFDTDTQFGDDELTQKIHPLVSRSRERGQSLLDIAVNLVEIVRQTAIESPDVVLSATELLEKLGEHYDESPSGMGATEEWDRTEKGDATQKGPDDEEIDFHTLLLMELTRQGIKPVSKIEPVNNRDLPIFLDRLKTLTVRTRKREAESDVWEIFVGSDAAKVDQAVELTDKLESATSAKAEAENIGKIGPLLGYPACCSSKFGHEESPFARSNYSWLHLARRMELGGQVAFELNPWAGFLATHYIPCSLNCENSKKMARKAREVVRELKGEAFLEASERSMQNPWLVLLRTQGCAAELLPDEEPGDRFRFHLHTFAHSDYGQGWELAAAAEADEIVMEGEQCLLLSRGRKLIDLSAQAFVWWHQKPLGTELWTRVLALREHHGQAPGPAQRVDQGVLSKEMNALRKGLEEILTILIKRGAKFGGSTQWQVVASGKDTLTLNLGHEQGQIKLFVSDARKTPEKLFGFGPLAFSYSNDTPLDSQERRIVVRDFIQNMKGYFAGLRAQSK